MRSLTVAPPTFHSFRLQYSCRSAETTNQELMSETPNNASEADTVNSDGPDRALDPHRF